MTKIELQKHKKIGNFEIQNKPIKELVKKQQKFVEKLINEIKNFKVPNDLNTIYNCRLYMFYKNMFNKNITDFSKSVTLTYSNIFDYDYFLSMLQDYFKIEYNDLIDEYYNLNPKLPKFKNFISFEYIAKKSYNVKLLKKTKLMLIDDDPIKFVNENLLKQIELSLIKNYPEKIINNKDIPYDIMFYCKKLNVRDVIYECLKQENKKYGKYGELLLFEQIKSNYPDQDNLYYEIINLLNSDIKLIKEYYFGMEDQDEGWYSVRQFYYKISKFDDLYCTIKNGRLIFFDNYNQAINNSDYLINSMKKGNTNKIKILTKKKLMSSLYRWTYYRFGYYIDMVGNNKDTVFKIDRNISYKTKKDKFNDLDIHKIMEKKLFLKIPSLIEKI